MRVLGYRDGCSEKAKHAPVRERFRLKDLNPNSDRSVQPEKVKSVRDPGEESTSAHDGPGRAGLGEMGVAPVLAIRHARNPKQ
jgi:hypothetical protein